MEPIKITENDIKKARKRIWDNYKVIGEVRKAPAIKLVLAAAARDGVKYINIREFYLKKSTNEWKPARDGITIPIKLPINEAREMLEPYRVFLEVLQATAKALETLPIYDPNNTVYNERKPKSNDKN